MPSHRSGPAALKKREDLKKKKIENSGVLQVKCLLAHRCFCIKGMFFMRRRGICVKILLPETEL